MTAPSRGRRAALFAAAFAFVVLLDQLTKAAARAVLSDGLVTLIPGVMDLCLVFNRGAAFSLGEGHVWAFVAVAVVMTAACALYAVLGTPGRALTCALGVVAGGGVGNLVDRVTQGCVTDFFMTTFMDFAVFNVADIAITCGFVVALVLFWREDARRERARRGAEAEGEEQR